jgi:choline dehydrogenase-like flavoprotein
MSRGQLDEVLLWGSEPSLEDVVGWEFQGWNVNPMSRTIGSRKFKKGFFGNPEVYGDPAKEYAWGYNMTVEQNDFDEPWIPTPSPSAPRRHLFWGVQAGRKADKPLHPNTLVIDYRLWPEHFVLNPLRYTVDYLVYPNPADKTLLLGNSYIVIGPIKLFLGYFLLRRDADRSDYGRTSYALTAGQLETVEAFAEATLPREAVISARDVTWNIDRQLERTQSKRKRSLGLVMLIVEHILPRMSGSLRSFSKLTVSARRQLIEKKMRRAASPLLKDLAKIRSLFAAGYYGDERVHPSIGFKPFDKRGKPLDVLKPLEQPPVHIVTNPDDVITCDVCVVGSGAGGAVVAGTLAQSGHDVVLLEEGAHVPASEMKHDPGAMVAKLYKESGLQTTVDLDMYLLQGRALGGTTVINNAISFELRDDVLAEWRGEFAVNLDHADLRESFARVRREISSKPFPEYGDLRLPDIAGNNPRLLLNGWGLGSGDAVNDREHGFFEKNLNRCNGCGHCNFGCPYGRKLSMLETYIPKIKPPNGRVVVGCHVTGIEHHNHRATQVACELSSGKTLRVRARSVVISCGAIGSSVLLMKSGIKVKHGLRNLVGTRFSFNAGAPMFGLFDDAVNAHDAMQMGGYLGSTDGVKTGRYLIESHFDPPWALAASLPGWFEQHADRMRQFTHMASAGVLVRTKATGRVKRTRLFRDTFGPVKYRWDAEDLGALIEGMSQAAAAWFASGAASVIPATFKDVELTREEFGRADAGEIEAELRRHIRRPDDLTLGSAHLQGGNPMGELRSMSVVDSEFRVRGFDNLYVCDASVFPSSVGVNPQLSIMAMADYFAHLNLFGRPQRSATEEPGVVHGVQARVIRRSGSQGHRITI